MKEILENGRLVLRLMQDARVPTWIKVVIPAIVILYFISPIDLIPDFLIGPGQLDDLGVILLGMTMIVRFSPKYIVDEHRRALGYEVEGTPPPASTAGNYWSAPTSGASNEPPKQGDGTIEGEYRVMPSDSNEQTYG